MNIIEPCCAERQLGQLLREAHGQAALFQTNGDVTAKLFIKDTMLLSGVPYYVIGGCLDSSDDKPYYDGPNHNSRWLSGEDRGDAVWYYWPNNSNDGPYPWYYGPGNN